ncbi:hypothetical protein [Microseira sp. BLCC-F43]|uniref:hypothetical protein n=1 Tax=Microseira sp. BLCC-F43 TaxID=3153602 RepID=UPI0035B723B8
MLSPKARLLSQFSNSRINFGIFRKQNGNLLSQFTPLLSDLSNFRNHHNYRYVAKAVQNLPILAQLARYQFQIQARSQC